MDCHFSILLCLETLKHLTRQLNSQIISNLFTIEYRTLGKKKVVMRGEKRTDIHLGTALESNQNSLDII